MSDPLGDEQREGAVFLGNRDAPSDYCLYLLAPFAIGQANTDDVTELLAHAVACDYCRSWAADYFVTSDEQSENGAE